MKMIKWILIVVAMIYTQFSLADKAVSPMDVFKRNIGAKNGVNKSDAQLGCRFSAFAQPYESDLINLAGDVATVSNKIEWWGGVESNDRYFKTIDIDENVAMIQSNLPDANVDFYFTKKDLKIFSYKATAWGKMERALVTAECVLNL